MGAAAPGPWRAQQALYCTAGRRPWRTLRCPPPPLNTLQPGAAHPCRTYAEVADRPGGTVYATGRALYVTPKQPQAADGAGQQ